MGGDLSWLAWQPIRSHACREECALTALFSAKFLSCHAVHQAAGGA